VMPNHPLAGVTRPTFEQLGSYPLVTFASGRGVPRFVQSSFAAEGLYPRVALTARDSDVIKTYVRLGLGVGIIANMSVDATEDADLISIDASHLFETQTTSVGVPRNGFVRQYVFDFLQLLGPHLKPNVVADVIRLETQEQVDAVFAKVDLPMR